jgi:hypothetical protein
MTVRARPPSKYRRLTTTPLVPIGGNLIVSVYNNQSGLAALERLQVSLRDRRDLFYHGTLGENLRRFELGDGAVDERLPLRYALIETLPGYEIATITELLCDACDHRRPGDDNGIANIEPNFQCGYSAFSGIGINYTLRSTQSMHDTYCDRLNVKDARKNGISGAGVKVVVVDSGYEKTGVLAGFLDVCKRGNRKETDALGHGTAMADIIRDVAPDASIHSVRISEGTRLKLWNAMLGIAAASFQFDADIINLSFGLSTSIQCPQCGQSVSNCPNCGHDLPVISHTLESFLLGIVHVDAGKTGPPIIVSATGNKGHKGVDKPADYGLSVAVGSINSALSRSPFSNYDPSHSQFIVMPGGDEDDHQQATEWVGEGSLGKCLGTSPATAYASSILALYLSDQNYYDADRIQFLQNVFNKCDTTWSTYNLAEHGKGYLPYIP